MIGGNFFESNKKILGESHSIGFLFIQCQGFITDSGNGPLVTVYKPEEGKNLCDGEWHTVKAIKSAYVITVSVDDISSEPSLGDASSYVTQTTRPLFIGGHPHLHKVIIMHSIVYSKNFDFFYKRIAMHWIVQGWVQI